MAKEKKPLTPEEVEIKAIKKAKSGENATKAFAVVLALALTIGVVFSGRSVAKKAVEKANAEATPQEEQTQAPEEDPFAEDNNNNGGQTNEPQSQQAGDNQQAGNNQQAGDNQQAGGNQTAATSKADAVKLLNDVTAKASKGNYSLDRKCAFTKNIDVGGATKTIDDIIKGIVKKDEWEGNDNWGINEVVGNFIGVKSEPVKTDVKGGAPADKEFNKNYLMKATTVTEDDLANFKASGNKYLFQIKDTSNPQRDNNSAMAHATNDFITQTETDEALQREANGLIKFDGGKTSTVKYTKIILEATIDGGKLTNLKITYNFAADLNLKATFIPIHGTGAAKTELVYSNIAY